MSKLLTRRTLVTAGLATATGASGIGTAIHFAGRYGLIPPDSGGILGIGNTLTYASQRLLTSNRSLAREFNRSEISKFAPVNGPAPQDETYREWLANGFKGWRLQIEGLVARPVSLTLEELRNMPAESHILLHACEEGWSYIAEWTGVRLSSVLDFVGTRPEAKYVVFETLGEPQSKHGGSARSEGEHRYGGCASSADPTCLWHERRGDSGRLRRTCPPSYGATTRLQEQKVSVTHHHRGR